MKKIFTVIFLFPVLLFAQSEYVDANNSVYSFLERMETLHLIKNYNSFEIPKTRKEVVGYIKQVIINEDELDKSDFETLQDLKIEFEYEISKSLSILNHYWGKAVLIYFLRARNIFFI